MADTERRGIGISFVVDLLLFFLLLVAPFLASGDWGWTRGLLYSGFTAIFTLGSRAVALGLNPGLARERATAGAMRDTKRWDRWIVPLVALWLPLLTVAVAGLDERFGWSASMPAPAMWLGTALLASGYSVGTWAMAVNAFFSSHVRIQSDRGHRVVSTGPYAVVRHPAYATGVLGMCGVPLLLDSPPAFLPVAILCILVVIRTRLEDRTLLAELPGYREYARRVRYRLVPGLW